MSRAAPRLVSGARPPLVALRAAVSAAPLADKSQAAIAASPSPPCLKVLSPILRPLPSARKTQWLWLPQSTPAYHGA